MRPFFPSLGTRKVAASSHGALELAAAQARYAQGEPRSIIFRDLVRDSIRQQGAGPVTLLDIGCGRGFDGHHALQQSLAKAVTNSIGIEPDPSVIPGSYFTELHRRKFEDLDLPAEKIHVAYAVFVLEHVQDPALFWRKLHHCMAPGGVFWGFTVDSRHPFSFFSKLTEQLHIKDLYLNLLRGRRGHERYENYPTFYRTNRPKQVRRDAPHFRQSDFLSLHRPGQLDYYFPRFFWRPLHLLERWSIALHLPGSCLIMRLEK